MSVPNEAPPFRFIVKHDGKYYLTHELWEFDPSRSSNDLNEDQDTSLKQISTTFEGGTPTGGAVEIGSRGAAAFTEITRVKSSPGR